MLFVTLTVCVIASVVGGWWCSRAKRLKWAWLTAQLMLPLVVYTLWFATLPPSEQPFYVWWLVGLAYLSIPLSAWVISGVIGFAAGHLRDDAAR